MITRDIDVTKLFPPIHGASNVTSLYFQPVTISRDPVSGVKNTATYRAAVQGPTRLTVNARWDQHTGYLRKPSGTDTVSWSTTVRLSASARTGP